MEYYERILIATFGQSITVRVVFLVSVLLLVGLPYLTRTWRDLFSVKYKLELYRAHLEVLRTGLELVERAGSSDTIQSVRGLVNARVSQILAAIPWSVSPSTQGERPTPALPSEPVLLNVAAASARATDTENPQSETGSPKVTSGSPQDSRTAVLPSETTSAKVVTFVIGSLTSLVGTVLLSVFIFLSLAWSVLCVVLAARAKGPNRYFFYGLGIIQLAQFAIGLIWGLLK